MTSGRPSLLLLLPPSEGKAEGGRTPTWKPGSGVFGRRLGARRVEILEALTAAGGGDAKLLGVSGAHLDRARRANLSLRGAATLPASARYTGVVWDHLSPTTLSKRGLARASESVVVVSGLLGLAGFDDPLPDYRLKMGASLAPLGRLSTWWRDDLSAALNARARSCHVIDLLPGEHRAAWHPTPDDFASLSVVSFVEKSGKVAGHDAKAAKGLLARHLLENVGGAGKDPIAVLSSWTHPRFTLQW